MTWSELVAPPHSSEAAACWRQPAFYRRRPRVLSIVRAHPERVRDVATLAEDEDWLIWMRPLAVLEACSVSHYSSARQYRSLRDEFAELPTSLAQARSFQHLGDRPLVVVTAAREAQAGWLPLQDRMATLSTSSSHRVVPLCTRRGCQ